MPWSNQGGNNGNGNGGWNPGGGNRGPWGGGGGGGGGNRGQGPQPPDLDELLRKSQDRLKQVLPGGGQFGGKLVGLGIVVLAVIWGLSGLYRVEANEEGVELIFGRAQLETTKPGLRYNWPAPIGHVITVEVTTQRRLDIGVENNRDKPEESMMLTGDQNIVDIDMAVIWQVKPGGASQYLFSLDNPDLVVKAVAESAVREIVGQMPIEEVRTERRDQVETDTKRVMQKILDEYNSGIDVREVKLLQANPPAQVIEAFRDVQSAQADAEKSRNEAESYQNDIIPRARGEAEQIRQEAEAYKEERIANANGEASRFNALLTEYKANPTVVRDRMYLETLKEIYAGMDKVILDTPNNSVQPYLPLQDLLKKKDR